MASKIREKIRKELRENREVTKYSDKYEYYARDWKENVIGEMSPEHYQMFKEGAGDELEDKITPAKAKAIDSSSMLSYNFFRNIDEQNTITIDRIVYSKVFFEVKLSTLRTSNAPANLDVALISKDSKSVLFIESKFLEYLESESVSFSESYFNEESYYESKEKNDLITIAKSFKNIKGHYNYGIKQNICHLISISNISKSKEARIIFQNRYKNKEQMIISSAQTYRFLNILFFPSHPEAEDLYNQYIKDLKKFKDNLPNSLQSYIGKTFIMTYRDLYEKMSDKISSKAELRNRYIAHHK